MYSFLLTNAQVPEPTLAEQEILHLPTAEGAGLSCVFMCCFELSFKSFKRQTMVLTSMFSVGCVGLKEAVM